MTDQYFRPRNWTKYQHYKDRQPPWIKLHSDLLDQEDFRQLPDTTKAHLMCLWVLYARVGRSLPVSSLYLSRIIGASSRHVKRSLDLLLSKKFIELCDRNASIELAQRKHDASPETYREETETETYKKEAGGTDVPARPISDDLKCAVDAWNALADECSLARVQRVTPARKTKLTRRLADCDGPVGWDAALDKIRGSSFLLGDNERGWKADFDFVLQETSFTKIMEGKYDRPKGNGAAHGGRTEESDRRAIIAGVGLESFRRS